MQESPRSLEPDFLRQGNLKSGSVGGGDPHNISYSYNEDNEITKRDDAYGGNTSNYVHEVHYYFNGIAIGDVSNNGTSNVDYVASMTAHRAIPGYGDFQNGATSGTSYANFDQSYDPINGLNYQNTSSSYTVQFGDTLQSIALQLWGDASFWYLIADANGLTGSETLAPGTDLIIPNKVHNIHNNTGTFSVYDPNADQGNLLPIAPKDMPQPDTGGGCGAFGAMINQVIGAVVSYFFSPLLGDAVTQLLNMAEGLQKSFNWGELGASVGTDLLLGVGGTTGDPLIDIPYAMARDAVFQGLELAFGAKKSFNFLEVGMSGLDAGLFDGLANSGLQIDVGDGFVNNVLNNVVSGAAAWVATAAVATLKKGTDFGDNLMSELPSAVANTVGNIAMSQLDDMWSPSSNDQPAAGTDGGQVGDTTISVSGDAPTPLTISAIAGTDIAPMDIQPMQIDPSQFDLTLPNLGDGANGPVAIPMPRPDVGDLSAASAAGYSDTEIGTYINNGERFDAGQNTWVTSDGVAETVVTPNDQPSSEDTNAGYDYRQHFVLGPIKRGHSGLFSWGYQTYKSDVGEHGESITVKYNGNTNNLQWIQHYTATGSYDTGVSTPDYVKGSTPPFYDSTNALNQSPGTFFDVPGRSGDTGTWRSDLSLVHVNPDGSYNVIGSFKYGFDIKNNSVILLPVVKVGP